MSSDTYTAIRDFLASLKIGESRLNGEGPYPCPLHAQRDSATLAVENAGTPGVYFRCAHKSCRFVGSPAELAYRVKNTPTEIAVKDFTADGRFRGMMFASTGTLSSDRDHLHTSVREHQKQRGLQTFLKAGRGALTTQYDKLYMGHLPGWINKETLLRADCGFVCPGSAPSCVTALQDTKYSTLDHLIFPYFQGPTITQLKVFNLQTGVMETHGTTKAPGIFLERNLSWPVVRRLTLLKSEFDALFAVVGQYHLGDRYSGNRVNPAMVSHPEALSKLPCLEEVVLVDHPADPLTIKDTLGYIRASERCARCTVNVNSLSQGLRSFDKLKAVRELAEPGVGVWEWMADHLYRKFASDRDAVVCELSATPLRDKDREALVAELEPYKDAEELIEHVQLISCHAQETILQGMTIRRDPSGYFLMDPEMRTLSNFAIYIDRFVKHPKDIEVVGYVRTDCPEDPPFPIRISYKKLNTRQDISDLVWAAMDGESKLDLESSALPFNWFTLLRRFDKAPKVAPVTRLGAKGLGLLYFPKFSLNTRSGKIDEGRAAALMPAETHLRFAGIVPGAITALSCYKELLQIDHPSITGFNAALGHIVHGLLTSATRKDYRPRHLFFHTMIDEQPLWEPTLEQLVGFFAGDDAYQHIRELHQLYKLQNLYSTTGALPHFCQVGLQKGDLAEAVLKAPMPLIGLVSTNQSAAVVRHNNTCLVQQDVAAFGEMEAMRIPEDLLARLRTNFPALLQQVARSTAINAGSLSHTIPSNLGVRWICDTLNIDTPCAVLDMVSDRRVFINVNTPESFILCLSAAISRGKVSISPSFTSSKNTGSIGYYKDDGDIVLWQQLATAAANSYNGESVFAANHLHSKDLKESAEYKRHWVVSREWWNSVCQRGDDILQLPTAGLDHRQKTAGSSSR